MTNAPTAIIYTRVSTADQAQNGFSLAKQEADLRAEAERRGWGVVVMAEEGKSGKNVTGRPVLQEALRMLDRGDAQVLMTVRLDRLSRSVQDFAGLLDRSAKKGWGLVMLSPNIDTSDAAGRFTANVLASAAQYERELISVRVREGMQQAKSEGARFGFQVAPEFLPTYARVLKMHADGMSLNKIATTLDAENVPTARGGRWAAATVRRIVLSETAKTLA
jgi:DNA invertase Pin-like site-specific DNA recombinase